jgi:hypothetical protein
MLNMLNLTEPTLSSANRGVHASNGGAGQLGGSSGLATIIFAATCAIAGLSAGVFSSFHINVALVPWLGSTAIAAALGSHVWYIVHRWNGTAGAHARWRIDEARWSLPLVLVVTGLLFAHDYFRSLPYPFSVVSSIYLRDFAPIVALLFVLWNKYKLNLHENSARHDPDVDQSVV